MFLLDTVTISELRKQGRAHPNVRAWAGRHSEADFYISAITLMELENGAQRKRRTDPVAGAVLLEWIHTTIIPGFMARHALLAFDAYAALVCAELHSPNTRPWRDSQIAATAISKGLTLATRNVADFEGMPLIVLNPWA